MFKTVSPSVLVTFGTALIHVRRTFVPVSALHYRDLQRNPDNPFAARYESRYDEKITEDVRIGSYLCLQGGHRERQTRALAQSVSVCSGATWKRCLPVKPLRGASGPKIFSASLLTMH